MTKPPIELTGIHKAFGELEVLRGVDLSVERGEVVVLMGPSGSGKTTLVRCMNLLEEPDSGHVRICDCAFSCGASRDGRGRARLMQRARQQTGMVFQQFNLFPHMTALGNVIEGPRQVRKLPTAEAIALGERLLDRVGLADKRDVHPSRLSGGQKQRVAIARALAMEPEVVLFDEPTSALDPELHAEVLEVIQELAGDGMTMVIVTHETHFAREVADRIVFMDGGVVVEDATAEAFFTRPSKERVRTFLRLVDHSGAVVDAPAPRVGEEAV
ncbi:MULTISPECIES: amino acid ABC transporter ATP-binding protein [Prauserella]|uniref:Ectoine/hydroxyectoine ABC transporter ATP-binding protein EhuA n=2 Tax=Prauserella TaxID=142577 RepID=A0A318L993_9PSEU|nr:MULTISPECIES: amino acid ABC transporter ATP-binding protein [Prauserella]PXY16777.1 ectoine/hydroxyectoine ABC transporter ATP-binding protein EhuA [Prauserella coralliicola]PXY17488.1 ectoine/hydroxyectoine ABC transporter ATP-binding protein EhuA [Prauserella flavalba]RBM15273.1 ectoine/hydroxyectoine ABC transporter ATP-binding protein EhuA [Prauserella sp. PE36]TKG59688.1 amino acid ABC transporter ATP-binding protein [Prauserella endophytica]